MERSLEEGEEGKGNDVEGGERGIEKDEVENAIGGKDKLYVGL